MTTHCCRELSMALPQPYVHYVNPKSRTSNLLPVKSKESIIGEDYRTELKSTYHDSYGGSGGFRGPSYKMDAPTKLVPVPPSPRRHANGSASMHRFSSLEDRLSSQEKAAQDLLGIAIIYSRSWYKERCGSYCKILYFS